ncbi:glycosyltransferase family 4 protein [Nitratireductor luteus]|uniref:glycosyltransferase family 4 protein n=1 Tax=Nitratireductor luteus TaxID=2976980 RepID=UPI003B848CA7
MVLPSLNPGGSERVMTLLANHLAERNWRISIVTLEGSEKDSYYATHPAVEIIRLGLQTARNNWIRALWLTANRIFCLRRTFLNQRSHLVISFLTRTNILSVMAASGTGIPVVVSERNNPELQEFGFIWSWLRRQLYPRAFGLVTITKGAMDFFPPKERPRTWVIPNPVALPADLPDRRGNKTLAAVGRLVPQKGFDLLLEAFARIASVHDEWQLMIWGEGPERSNLIAQRDALGLGTRVLFPGVSERPCQWIESADVFVLSSRYEGWGNVLAEAMAAGLPVVSFNCRHGPAEIITPDKDGLLVPNGDIGALSNSLSLVLGNEALRRRLGKAATRSARRFAIDIVISSWDEIVHCALQANRGKI